MATTSYGTPYVVSADLVSGYPSTSLSLADRVDDISFKGNGINNQTGTTYTLDILDAGKTVTLSNSSAVTVTIPTNTAEAIEIGSIVRFNNKGAGTVTIQPDGGVTLNGGNISLAQNAAAQIVKLDTNTWGAIDSLASASGLELISPTSIANSGGSASASGGAVTFTTVNSVSLNGVFSSTYQNYEIVLPFESSSTGADMTLRLRASGSDATGTNYYIQQLYVLGANAPSGATGNNAQYVFAGSGTTKYAGRITLYRPNEAANTFANSFFWNQATALMFRGMEHQVASAYDGFTIYPSTGTITGTVRVYGYKN